MNWTIEEWDSPLFRLEYLGSQFLLGNGYLGSRGTLEEYQAEQYHPQWYNWLYRQNRQKKLAKAVSRFACTQVSGQCSMCMLLSATGQRRPAPKLLRSFVGYRRMALGSSGDPPGCLRGNLKEYQCRNHRGREFRLCPAVQPLSFTCFLTFPH